MSCDLVVSESSEFEGGSNRSLFVMVLQMVNGVAGLWYQASGNNPVLFFYFPESIGGISQ